MMPLPALWGAWSVPAVVPPPPFAVQHHQSAPASAQHWPPLLVPLRAALFACRPAASAACNKLVCRCICSVLLPSLRAYVTGRACCAAWLVCMWWRRARRSTDTLRNSADARLSCSTALHSCPCCCLVLVRAAAAHAARGAHLPSFNTTPSPQTATTCSVGALCCAFSLLPLPVLPYWLPQDGPPLQPNHCIPCYTTAGALCRFLFVLMLPAAPAAEPPQTHACQPMYMRQSLSGSAASASSCCTCSNPGGSGSGRRGCRRCGQTWWTWAGGSFLSSQAPLLPIAPPLVPTCPSTPRASPSPATDRGQGSGGAVRHAGLLCMLRKRVGIPATCTAPWPPPPVCPFPQQPATHPPPLPPASV